MNEEKLGYALIMQWAKYEEDADTTSLLEKDINEKQMNDIVEEVNKVLCNYHYPEKLPKIGKLYDCYDDGKICDDRRYKVKITDIVPFDKVSKSIYNQWEDAKRMYYWVFADKTDYFVLADSYERGKFNVSQSVFVRTVEGEWYSIGRFWNNGLLIVE